MALATVWTAERHSRRRSVQPRSEQALARVRCVSRTATVAAELLGANCVRCSCRPSEGVSTAVDGADELGAGALVAVVGDIHATARRSCGRAREMSQRCRNSAGVQSERPSAGPAEPASASASATGLPSAADRRRAAQTRAARRPLTKRRAARSDRGGSRLPAASPAFACVNGACARFRQNEPIQNSSITTPKNTHP